MVSAIFMILFFITFAEGVSWKGAIAFTISYFLCVAFDLVIINLIGEFTKWIKRH